MTGKFKKTRARLIYDERMGKKTKGKLEPVFGDIRNQARRLTNYLIGKG